MAGTGARRSASNSNSTVETRLVTLSEFHEQPAAPCADDNGSVLDNSDDGDAPLRPLPRWADFYYLASVANVASCVGYVFADLNRGFFAYEVVAANYVFVALGGVTLLQGLFFYLSWHQLGDAGDRACCPFAAAEWCNVCGAAVFAATAVCYIFDADPASPNASAIANAVVVAECAANFVLFGAAVLYFRVWCIETRLEEEEEDEDDGQDDRVCVIERRHVAASASSHLLAHGDQHRTYINNSSDKHQDNGNDDAPPCGLDACCPAACECALICRDRHCGAAGMQEQVWNVVPGALYALASLVGLIAHFTAYRGAVYGTAYVTTNETETIVVYDRFVHVAEAACFSNVYYAPDAFAPPCNNPLLFNASCTVDRGIVCFSADLRCAPDETTLFNQE
jgi:hypothetical protein